MAASKDELVAVQKVGEWVASMVAGSVVHWAQQKASQWVALME